MHTNVASRFEWVPVPCRLAYVAEVRDVVARGVFAADAEEEVLRPLVVRAPDPKSHRPVGQDPPEVGFPDGLYCGRVQSSTFGVEDMLQFIGLAIGFDELEESSEFVKIGQGRAGQGRAAEQGRAEQTGGTAS